MNNLGKAVKNSDTEHIQLDSYPGSYQMRSDWMLIEHYIISLFGRSDKIVLSMRKHRIVIYVE